MIVEHRYDVVIVGAGGAGMRAAVTFAPIVAVAPLAVLPLLQARVRPLLTRPAEPAFQVAERLRQFLDRRRRPAPTTRIHLVQI